RWRAVNLSPGRGQNAYFHAPQHRVVGKPETTLELLVKAELHVPRDLLRPLGKSEGIEGRALLRARNDLQAALEILLALPSLREQHPVAVFVGPAVRLDLQVGNA